MLDYLDLGKENSPCIICLHGLGATKEYFKPQFELSSEYRLIVPDLRGHGGSELIGQYETATLKNIAKDVIELIDHLNPKGKIYILGHSLGCSVAMEIYRQQPERASGLVLADGTPYISVSVANYIKNKSEKMYLEDKNKLIQQIINNCLYDKSFINEANEMFYLSDNYLDYITVAAGHSFFPTLLSYNKPLLLISGAFDNVIPPINQTVMHWLVPNSRFEILNSGHLSNIECSEEFNQAIRKFIGGQVNE